MPRLSAGPLHLVRGRPFHNGRSGVGPLLILRDDFARRPATQILRLQKWKS